LPAGSTGRSDDTSSSSSGAGTPWQHDVKTTVTPLYSRSHSTWINNFSKDRNDQNNGCGQGFSDTRSIKQFSVTLSIGFGTPSIYGFSAGITLFSKTFEWGGQPYPYTLAANPCNKYCVSSWIIAARGCMHSILDTIEVVTVTENGITTTYTQNSQHHEDMRCTEEGNKKVVWNNNKGRCCPNDCS
jgi:hypothetical protein